MCQYSILVDPMAMLLQLQYLHALLSPYLIILIEQFFHPVKLKRKKRNTDIRGSLNGNVNLGIFTKEWPMITTLVGGFGKSLYKFNTVFILNSKYKL